MRARARSVSDAIAQYSYERSDMCDKEIEPAANHGFIDPGIQVEAIMHSLVPGKRYYYSVGDDAYGWTSERSFRAPAISRPEQPTRLIAFGDMGQTLNVFDGSQQHSWDFGNKGEIPAPNTTRLAYDLMNEQIVDAVVHIGDISYAVGYLSEWDNFMFQIEPVASAIPWQVAIGNHEQVYSASFIEGTDSGGECGVPYNVFFPFASQPQAGAPVWNKRQPWYSFDVGSIHITVMSTEHDYQPSTPQHAFLESDLAAVNRSRTPWVIFAGHRPMYIDSTWDGDQQMASFLADSVEPLLLRYGVDLAIWGHHHSYQRTCKMARGKCVGPRDEGVVHAVIGMAGYDLSLGVNPELPPGFEYVNVTHHGLSQIFAANSTALQLAYYPSDEKDGVPDPLDSVWLRKWR